MNHVKDVNVKANWDGLRLKPGWGDSYTVEIEGNQAGNAVEWIDGLDRLWLFSDVPTEVVDNHLLTPESFARTLSALPPAVKKFVTLQARGS